MDELTEPTPLPSPTPRRRNLFAGAVLGAVALAGTVVGIGAVAGAQSEPSTTSNDAAAAPLAQDTDGEADEFFDADWEAFDECMADQLGDLWIEPEFDLEGIDFDELDLEDLEGIDFDELDLEDLEGIDFDELGFEEVDDATMEQWDAADEACQQHLPADVLADMELWAPYEECIDNSIGDLPDPWMNGEEPSDAEWAAYDEAWEAADAACVDLLPEEARAEMAAWDAFDECLADAGVLDEADMYGPVVHVETGEGLEMIEFGETSGSVTISGDVNGVTVTTDGGVTVLDEAALDAEWEQFDAAYEQCEQQLPEELRDDMYFEDDAFMDDESYVED